MLCQVCNRKLLSKFFLIYQIKCYHIFFVFVGLTLGSMYKVHYAEWDWTRQCVVGRVMCMQVRTECLCHLLAVLQSIFYVGERLAYGRLPNNSFLFPYYMVLTVPVLLLQCPIHVYCLICVEHMLILGYYFLCNVHVLCVLFLLIYRIVLCIHWYKYCIWVCIFH